MTLSVYNLHSLNSMSSLCSMLSDTTIHLTPQFKMKCTYNRCQWHRCSLYTHCLITVNASCLSWSLTNKTKQLVLFKWHHHKFIVTFYNKNEKAKQEKQNYKRSCRGTWLKAKCGIGGGQLRWNSVPIEGKTKNNWPRRTAHYSRVSLHDKEQETHPTVGNRHEQII